MKLSQCNMTVQQYRLKFIQISRYAPHIVVDSRSQMNKILHGYQTWCKRAYEEHVAKKRNIFRIMICPKNIFVNNLREDTKYNNNPIKGTYLYPQQKQDG